MKLRIANKILSDGMNVTRHRGSTIKRALVRAAKAPDLQPRVLAMVVLCSQWKRLKAYILESSEKLAS